MEKNDQELPNEKILSYTDIGARLKFMAFLVTISVGVCSSLVTAGMFWNKHDTQVIQAITDAEDANKKITDMLTRMHAYEIGQAELKVELRGINTNMTKMDSKLDQILIEKRGR